MFKLRRLLAAALLASSTSPALAAAYDVDIVHSHVAFFIDHLGFSKVIGVVNDFEGTFDFDATKPEASALNVKLKVASISTNNSQRDSDIQGADWFNATEFPEITFVGKTFKKVTDTTGTITGDLSFAGATHEATLDVVFNKEGENPWSKAHVVGFSAKASILRSDFGMKTYLPMIGDKVDLLIEIEGTQKP